MNSSNQAIFFAIKELLVLCKRENVFCRNAQNALIELIGEDMANEALALFVVQCLGLGSREAANLVVSFMRIEHDSITWDNNISFSKSMIEFLQKPVIKISHPSWQGSWEKEANSWIFKSNL